MARLRKDKTTLLSRYILMAVFLVIILILLAAYLLFRRKRAKKKEIYLHEKFPEVLEWEVGDVVKLGGQEDSNYKELFTCGSINFLGPWAFYVGVVEDQIIIKHSCGLYRNYDYQVFESDYLRNQSFRERRDTFYSEKLKKKLEGNYYNRFLQKAQDQRKRSERLNLK